MRTLVIDKVDGKVSMVVAGLLILLPLLVFAGRSAISERPTASKVERAAAADVTEVDAPASRQVWLSPAAAMSNGKPTLLLFTPYEMCQIRYCPQPEFVAERLAEEAGEGVNFVPVTVYAIPAADAGAVAPAYRLENWDLYPVPPYDTWLPPAEETQFGLGLQAPVFTLVDSRGALVSQAHDLSVLERFYGRATSTSLGIPH